MKRHAFDALSFVFGAVFLVLAGALSVEGLDVGPTTLRWIGAGILLVLGVMMLLTSIIREASKS